MILRNNWNYFKKWGKFSRKQFSYHPLLNKVAGLSFSKAYKNLWLSFLTTIGNCLVFSISPYSVQTGENRNQNNSEYEHFLHSDYFTGKLHYVDKRSKYISIYNSEAVARRCFSKIGALKNLAKFTGNNLFRRFFSDKVADLRPIKKSLQHSFFFWRILQNFL